MSILAIPTNSLVAQELYVPNEPPIGLVELDHSNPITSRIEIALIPQHQNDGYYPVDLANGYYFDNPGAVYQGTAFYGSGVQDAGLLFNTANESAVYAELACGEVPAVGSGEFTFAMRLAVDTAGSFCYGAGFGTGSPAFFVKHQSVADEWGIHDGTNPHGSGYSGLTNGDIHTLVWRRLGTSVSYWRDGFEEVGSPDTIADNFTQASLTINSYSYGSVGYGGVQGLYGLAYWTRALTEDEIHELSDNFYTLIKPAGTAYTIPQGVSAVTGSMLMFMHHYHE